MRKLSSVVGAALLAVTTFAAPANAQTPMAGGSCSPGSNAWGFTDINSDMVNPITEQVPAAFFRVDYSGVSAPTTIGVIVRRNDELQDQVGVQSFTADSSGGTYYGALVASGVSVVREGGVPVGYTGPGPDNQGFANSQAGARRGRQDGSGSGSRTQNSPTGSATIVPGEYVFYVYTGSRGDVYNVKDGTVSRNAFIADEKGYLGKFSCGVSTNAGTGPG